MCVTGHGEDGNKTWHLFMGEQNGMRTKHNPKRNRTLVVFMAVMVIETIFISIGPLGLENMTFLLSRACIITTY